MSFYKNFRINEQLLSNKCFYFGDNKEVNSIQCKKYIKEVFHIDIFDEDDFNKPNKIESQGPCVETKLQVKISCHGIIVENNYIMEH